jgi:DNA-binding CsgD family transcriptional regulator/tetratricopeptide (TPR) repeat protein/energy-coupling factor transporter ATP-binding protein EcfA2
MVRVVGRATLLEEVVELLRQGESVALHGPTGVGKSALLDTLEEQVRRDRDAAVIRASGAADERALPYATLRDLISQVPRAVTQTLPERLRHYAEDGLVGLVGLATTGEVRSDLGAVFHALLDTWSQRQPVVLLLDDVQLLDAESSALVGYARRRLVDKVGLVATMGPGDGEQIDVSDLHHLEVPPLDAADMVDLLCDHGLPPDVAHRVYVESGGMPSLALALTGAIGVRPTIMGAPTPLPRSIERVLRDRILGQPAEVRDTLVRAALLHRPTVRQLERSGRISADEEVRRSVLSGLVVQADGVVRFTPSALRTVITEMTAAPERADLHRSLGEVATSAGERLRHLALAEPRPDGRLSRELALAACDSAAAGARELGAELYLLAADRAPFELSRERVEWLATAVETAALANRLDLVNRALGDFLEASPTPGQLVRVRLAIPELAGSDVAVLDEVLTAALADAGDDDRLVARVLLQRARIALMESRPSAAGASAERAVSLLERLGDPDELALGLTTLAVARRWLGGDHASCLDRAVELAGPTPTGFLHTSPEYMAARFAFYDDRLDEAWSGFLSMLARVQRGAGMDHVHVLRCLVEVGIRAGRCREAAEYAARAAKIGEELDLDAHTTWFIAGLAELAAGDVARARTLAEHGAAAAEERGDTRYLIRHLVLLGQALLRTGEAGAARTAMLRIREIETGNGSDDPTVNRWHADLISAEVLLGRLDDAEATLAAARWSIERRVGTDGVAASLDRAEAELAIARGDLEAAEILLDRAAKLFGDLGMPIDLGRTLVVRGHLERRRRRVAAARAALHQAHELFASLHADSWADQVQAELTPGRAASDDPRLDVLTESEARVAREVAAGASNREIAERTFVSVKTVEATLTRIYRKLDLRSRTQLATLLVPAPPE